MVIKKIGWILKAKINSKEDLEEVFEVIKSKFIIDDYNEILVQLRRDIGEKEEK